MIWYAIRTLAGYETAVRTRMGRRAYPLLPIGLVDGPRGSARPVPLFPGYLFLGIVGPPDWAGILRLRGVIGPLAMSREAPPHRFSDDDIAWLKALQTQLIQDYQAAAMAASAEAALEGSPSMQRRRRSRKSRRAREARQARDALRDSLDAMPVSTHLELKAAA